MRPRALLLLPLILLMLPPLTPSSAAGTADWTAPKYEGGTFRLSDYRGKVVVLIFSQPTCSHCKRFVPMLASAWRSDPELSSDRYVVAVAMYSPYNPDAALPAFRSYNPPPGWILLLASWPNLVYFGVRYTATVVIIDPSGNVFAKIDPRDVPYIPDMVNVTVRKAKEAYHRAVDLQALVPSRIAAGEPLIIRGNVSGVNSVRVVLISPEGREEDYRAMVSSGHFQLSVTLSEPGTWTVRIMAGSTVRESKVRVVEGSAPTFTVLYGRHDRQAASILGMNATRAGEEMPQGNIIVLGGPVANPLASRLNGELGIRVEVNGSRGIIGVGARVWRFSISYGKSDYAIVASVERDDRRIILGEGLTRYGTRAAAILLSKSGGQVDGVMIIRWVDDNGNGSVDPGEVEVIFRGSLP